MSLLTFGSYHSPTYHADLAHLDGTNARAAVKAHRTEDSMPIIAKFLAVTWIIFAGLAWLIAKTKGRNPWIWLILGVLIGPLAMFVLIVLPKSKIS